MDTPICDFVRRYAGENTLRLHMPGHKGKPELGPEPLDITEIAGADSLYEASGIIAQSEANAGTLFGANTFYSAEGSSLCIRGMLYLACLAAKRKGKTPHILAAPNVHKAFLSAVALLNITLSWLEPTEKASYLSGDISPQELKQVLAGMTETPTAVYLTSPDYLGHMADIAGLASVCHQYGVLLLVDNAHGAYLKFLPESLHPMDLGADLCCDSAHKTLPVLTGGAYLHISKTAEPWMKESAKQGLALFGSTSPSYLILQSLDKANAYLEKDCPKELAEFLPLVIRLQKQLKQHGYVLYGEEPCKLTLAAGRFGYTGKELEAILADAGIVCEFADIEFVVMMLTPTIGEQELERIGGILCGITQKTPLAVLPPVFGKREQVLSVREAMLAPFVWMDARESVGRILAMPSVGCPPAVPIVICGQRIQEEDVKQFAIYGVEKLCVVKER